MKTNFGSSIAACILLLVIGEWPLQASSFWFTDSSLFQAPVEAIVGPSSQQKVVATNLNKAEDAKKSTYLPEITGQITKLAQTPEIVTEILVRGEPWVKLDQLQAEQQQCRCNVDWIQNQTNSMLNKWLASPNVANQMRLLLSNSTGASGDINRRDFKRSNGDTSANKSSSNNNNNLSSSNHWTAWTRSFKGNNESGTRAGSARVASPSTGSTRAKEAQFSRQQQHHHHLQPRLVQASLEPSGPKSEICARGEMGPSNLVRVKDRDALFDLLPSPVASLLSADEPLNSSSSDDTVGTKQQTREQTANLAASETKGNKQKSMGTGGLVFVESEQMLVVGTNFGWQPVQLMPALRDFRKTIAKFSLSSSEERRRLLLMPSDGVRQVGVGSPMKPMDNSIKPIIMRQGSIVGAKESAYQRRLAATAVYENDDDSGLDEGNEDGDDDDDDDDADADDEDLDEDNEDEDEEETESGNGLGLDGGDQRGSKIRRGNENEERDDLNAIKPVAKLRGSRNPPIGLGIAAMGRSAAAALVSASIENSVTMGSPVKLEQSGLARQQQQHSSAMNRAGDGGGERRMRLRLAALNEPFSGNVHGIRGADFECKRNAAKANVKGSFRAFLASGFQNLNEVVRYNVYKYPVVNLRGEILANSWHDLFKQSARIPNPLSRIYSFDGRHVGTDSNWPNKLVWHGATNKAGYRDSMHNCDGWHSDSLSKFGLASPLHPVRGAQAAKRRQRHIEKSAINAVGQNHHGQVFEVIDKYPCRMPLIVLCIETIGQHSDSMKENMDTSNMVASS